jgi:choline-sulfatase
MTRDRKGAAGYQRQPPPGDAANRRFRRRALIVVTAAAVVFMLVLRGRRPPGLPPGSAAGSNVLLVTIDTLRADRIGAYGSHAGLTPAIDRLAAQGVRFDAAFTPVPMTLPSHASILTGLEPPSHGVRNNTAFRLGQTPTLGTLLKQAGYRTGAFVGSVVLSRRFGLDRGFDVYDDRIGQDGAGGPHDTERRAAQVVQPAVDWILRTSAAAEPKTDAAGPADGGPWFAWIHLYDPHAPYSAPPEYARGLAPYDAEVAYTDAALGHGLESLRAAGALDRTIVVVVADHGESLGEHGESTHGLFAYDATLRVPMVVIAPGLGAGIVHAPVSTVDLAPTVLDLLGIPQPKDLDGRSLVNVDDRNRGRALYFEALDANLTRGWAPLSGVIADGWKYIELPIPELYDLARDPAEAQNLAARQGDRLRTLQARLKEMASRRRTAEAVRASIDPETGRRLKSLGYVASTGPSGTRHYSETDDPKTLVALNEAFYTAINEEAAGRRDQAVAALRSVIARRPDFLAARTSAAAMLEHDRPSEAIALLQAAPDVEASAAAQAELGLAFEAAGRLPEAARCLERAVELGNDDAGTLTSLGIVYARMRRFDEGRTQLRRALDADARSAEAWKNMGLLEMGAGHPADAAAAFRQAVTLDRAYAAAWRGLGAALASSDALAATKAWRTAVALDPTDYDTLLNLGLVLADGPQPADALPFLEQFVARAPRDRYGAAIARAGALVTRIERR